MENTRESQRANRGASGESKLSLFITLTIQLQSQTTLRLIIIIVLLMSRIIVTNIPKFVSQKELKDHFKNLGEITDCKIMKDEKGQSRKFGFLGFKDSNAAVLAQKNYDKTYLGVSKIRVERAKTRDQQQKGSQKINNKNGEGKSKKKAEESQDKFNKYKEIVKEGVKKSWDDLVTPQSSKLATTIVQNKEKGKKQRKQQKKVAKKVEQKTEPKAIEQVKAIKAPRLSEKNKKYISAPLGIDETRLYITNIPYHITEEEVKKQFAKFGNIKKVKVPMEYDGSAKGYAFVTYELPEEALRAFTQTDNKVVFGRIIHVKPAVQDIGEIIKTGKEADFEQKNKELYGDDGPEEKTSYKKMKKRQMRDKLNDTTSWNTLFLNPNTILERMSAKLGIEKSEILLSDDLAPKIALAEAEVVQQTKQWMVSQGLNVQFIQVDRNLCQRSQKVLLIKNLNYRTTQVELKQLFEFYGILNRIMLAPNRAIGIVEFSTKQFAANALEKLQNVKFKNNFLYLEYAPVGMLKEEDLVKEIEKMEEEIHETEELSKVIYLKNLNFQTQESFLTEFLAKVEAPKSTTIIRDKSGKSMGYGFAEFASNEQAIKVIKKLQNQILDGHKLILSISRKTADSQKYEKIKELKEKINKEEAISTKLIVKNLAFQATKNDVKELFKHYGSIKNIKLPKKMNGQHRGFGFVEYDSAQAAALAKQALSSSHLYGRKLVIEYEKGTPITASQK